MAMMNRDLKKLFNAGFRYVFIDEVTLMEDFIDSAAFLRCVRHHGNEDRPVRYRLPGLLAGDG